MWPNLHGYKVTLMTKENNNDSKIKYLKQLPKIFVRVKIAFPFYN